MMRPATAEAVTATAHKVYRRTLTFPSLPS